MGIEPTRSAWKAEVLPLNYTRAPTNKPNKNWRGKDSNLRRLSRQIYSLLPLTARVPLQNELGILLEFGVTVNKFIASNLIEGIIKKCSHTAIKIAQIIEQSEP